MQYSLLTRLVFYVYVYKLFKVNHALRNLWTHISLNKNTLCNALVHASGNLKKKHTIYKHAVWLIPAFPAPLRPSDESDKTSEISDHMWLWTDPIICRNSLVGSYDFCDPVVLTRSRCCSQRWPLFRRSVSDREAALCASLWNPRCASSAPVQTADKICKVAESVRETRHRWKSTAFGLLKCVEIFIIKYRLNIHEVLNVT